MPNKKYRKIEFVNQQCDKSCVVATIAMITGFPFHTIRDKVMSVPVQEPDEFRVYSLFGCPGSTPGTTSIYGSAEVSLVGLLNTFLSNQRYGKSGWVSIPDGLSTELPLNIELDFYGDTAAVGDVEIFIFGSQVNIGDTLDGTLPEGSDSAIVSFNNEAEVLKYLTFEINVESLLPGDIFAFSF